MKAVIKPIAVVALVLASVAWFGFGPKADAQSSQAAHKAVENGAVLLDVRTPEEFGAGHIPGAVNIPVQQLEKRIAEVGSSDKQVVVYCRSGNRSAKAKRMLEQAGFKDVIDLGAMTDW